MKKNNQPLTKTIKYKVALFLNEIHYAPLEAVLVYPIHYEKAEAEPSFYRWVEGEREIRGTITEKGFVEDQSSLEKQVDKLEKKVEELTTRLKQKENSPSWSKIWECPMPPKESRNRM